MFDIDGFVSQCVDASSEANSRHALKEVLERALTSANEMADAFAPSEGGLNLLHVTDDLTVLHVVWAPGMRLYPHDHRMWAIIGIYTGREDNEFFRRAGSDKRGLTESGGKQLDTGDTILLGDDTIHAVSNPLNQLTGAIHLYGGDFVNRPRSQWGPGPVEERPYDMEIVQQQFAEANERWHASEPKG
jgi:predicted metal-dependent enzyme (double-stranded beta helix superfamily)